MSYYICDTDILFEYIGGSPEALIFFNNPPVIVASVITYSEMLLACTNKKDILKLRKILAEGVAFLPIDRDISGLHVQLLDDYHLSHSLKLNDALIAATALFYSLPLATCNTKDFKFIKNLQLVEHNITPRRSGGGLFGATR